MTPDDLFEIDERSRRQECFNTEDRVSLRIHGVVLAPFLYFAACSSFEAGPRPAGGLVFLSLRLGVRIVVHRLRCFCGYGPPSRRTIKCLWSPESGRKALGGLVPLDEADFCQRFHVLMNPFVIASDVSRQGSDAPRSVTAHVAQQFSLPMP